MKTDSWTRRVPAAAGLVPLNERREPEEERGSARGGEAATGPWEGVRLAQLRLEAPVAHGEALERLPQRGVVARGSEIWVARLVALVAPAYTSLAAFLPGRAPLHGRCVLSAAARPPRARRPHAPTSLTLLISSSCSPTLPDRQRPPLPR